MILEYLIVIRWNGKLWYKTKTRILATYGCYVYLHFNYWQLIFYRLVLFVWNVRSIMDMIFSLRIVIYSSKNEIKIPPLTIIYQPFIIEITVLAAWLWTWLDVGLDSSRIQIDTIGHIPKLLFWYNSVECGFCIHLNSTRV